MTVPPFLAPLCLLAAPLQQVAVSPAGPAAPAIPSSLAGVIRADFVGEALPADPWFRTLRASIEGAPLAVGFDPSQHPAIAGLNGELILVAHKTPAEWEQDRSLVEVRVASQAVHFPGPSTQPNVLPVLFGPVPGGAGPELGIAYDAVIDANWSGVLDAGDWIDGLGDEPGFLSLRPPHSAGPYAVTELNYSGGTWLGQNTFYPTNVASLGELPLVVISHGNGHSHVWYDHLGFHLASWGYVVMSHQNNTQPGIESASTTTLTNTEWFLANLPTIGGGALVGHVDRHRIAWIGHSRGGEGVVRARRRIETGAFVPQQFALSDLLLVSSIAPTDFLGAGTSEPGSVPYHLWVGGADADVSGCASCELCQSFHLLGRALGPRQSISLHGVGHGAFHNGSGSTVSAGPCLVSRQDTHVLMKAHLVPLLDVYLRGNAAAAELLWRQWESAAPEGTPSNPCIVVDLTYRPDPSTSLVVDDYQSEPSTSVSSSGGQVVWDVDTLAEARLDDANTVFTSDASASNGMTWAGAGDASAGAVLQWSNADRVLRFELAGGPVDLRGRSSLSLAACQVTRHPLTNAQLGDLVFTVALEDAHGTSRAVRIDAYGGGIEEPYQRTSCGDGAGWGNEFETIRVPLENFRRDASGLDLSAVAALELRFGPSHGSASGRIGLDDVAFTEE